MWKISQLKHRCLWFDGSAVGIWRTTRKSGEVFHYTWRGHTMTFHCISFLKYKLYNSCCGIACIRNWITSPQHWCEVDINSLWPCDAISGRSSWSALVQVMACCLTSQAIVWTSVDLSSVMSCDSHLRAPSKEILKISNRIRYDFEKIPI